MDKSISGTIPLETLAGWLRAYGYEVRAPERDPIDKVVKIVLDQNGAIQMVSPGDAGETS